MPYSKEDLDELAFTLHLVYDRNWFMIAENDKETVAMEITVPDINRDGPLATSLPWTADKRLRCSPHLRGPETTAPNR